MQNLTKTEPMIYKLALAFLLIPLSLSFGNAKIIHIKEITSDAEIITSENQKIKIKNITLSSQNPRANFLLIQELSKFKNQKIESATWSNKNQTFDFVIPETQMLLSEKLLSEGLAKPEPTATEKQKRYSQKAEEQKKGMFWSLSSPDKKIKTPLPSFHSTRIQEVISGNQFITTDNYKIHLLGTKIPKKETTDHKCFQEQSLLHLEKYKNQKVILLSGPKTNDSYEEELFSRWVIFLDSNYSLNQEVIRTGNAKREPVTDLHWNSQLKNQEPLNPRGAFLKCLPNIMGIKSYE